MTDTRFADISEHQDGADLAAYRRSGFDVLILRAHNGNRPDNVFKRWQSQARAIGFTALGFYQYMVEGRDAVSQARDFINTVGSIHDNEFVICDNEEGKGSQIGRCEQWFRQVDSYYNRKSSLYAGQSWFKDRLGGAARWADRPRWMAAYSSREPSDPHEWWQNTSTSAFPGLGHPIDGNVFHGTSREFAAIVTGTTAPIPAGDVEVGLAVGTMPGGGQEVFVELASGEIKHKYQVGGAPGGTWSNWYSLGAPGK